MAYEFSFYSFAYFLAVLASAIAAAGAWQRRSAPGGLSLFWMMAAITEWTLASLMESVAVDLGVKIFWSKLAYVGAHLSPIFFLLFALQYTNHTKWLTRRNIALLFCPPALTILLAATNEWHHLIWAGFSPGPAGTNSYIYIHGVWFWVESVYINIILLAGTLVLLRFALTSKEIYRSQSLALVAASLIPWAGFALYLIKTNPFPGLDTTAVSLALSGAILVLVLLRLQLLDMVPVAREYLVENMLDGVLVLDYQDRIVDINPAAKEMFGLKPDRWIGQRAEAVLVDWPNLASHLQGPASNNEITLHSPDARQIDLRVSPLFNNKDELSGRLIVLRDISGRKAAEEEVQLAYHKLQVEMAEIEALQDKLREQAIRDVLTGLFNRRYLEETLERELSQAGRRDYPVAIVILDIDRFKDFNDQYGHTTGDALLRALGGMLLTNVRGGDIACRYGGDEFVLVLPDATPETAFQRSEELRVKFQNYHLAGPEGSLKSTFSAGIAFYPTDGISAAELIRAADWALYNAKTAGRNRVHAFKVEAHEV